jgi:hypothetical protein
MESTVTQLAAIFKNMFQKPKAPERTHAPVKVAENKQPAALAQSVLTSPTQHKYQTRSQRPITENTSSNTPLLPRVVIPMTGQAASPKVPARTRNLSARNSSKHDFWNMETANMAIALGASLVRATFFQLSSTSSNWQENGVDYPYEGSRSSTPLEIGFSNEAGHL